MSYEFSRIFRDDLKKKKEKVNFDQIKSLRPEWKSFTCHFQLDKQMDQLDNLFRSHR